MDIADVCLFFLGFIFGGVAGVVLEAKCWARNADRVERLYRFGKLFKVSYGNK